MEKKVSYVDLHRKPYAEVLEFQEQMRSKRINGQIDDLLIFCEHNPVYTVGKQNSDEDWLSSKIEIQKDKIDVVYCNRGGRITYHGPGQLIVYFIMKVTDHASGVRDFVHMLESVSIDMLKSLDLKVARNEKYPGIWINGKKIVAIGLHISQNVSMHGIAINIEPNMSHYKHIIPCGIKEYGVTCLVDEIAKKNISMQEIKTRFKKSFQKIFKCQLLES